jgi:hypothetical protein
MAPINNVRLFAGTRIVGEEAQVESLSVVFHTPPPAAATYIVLTPVGWAAMPVIRPLVFSI